MSDRILASAGVILCAYALSTLLVPPVRKLAILLGVMDSPGVRKCHQQPVPRMGGLAIFGSLVLVVWGSLFWLPSLQSSWVASLLPSSLSALSQYTQITLKLWVLFGGVLVVTLLGIADDFLGVDFSPHIKLGGQIGAALLVLPAGIYMDLLNRSAYLSMFVSVVWIVGITNSFNLLDNMDGLSSGIAIICSLVFLVLVMLKGEFFIALLLSALIGSILGFFQFNMRGGYIFMGDTGSLLIGYMLGCISLMARYVDPTDTSIFPVVAPLIILGLPLFDTLSVIVIRLREGRSIFKGDQMHLSHRLVRMGMTMRQAVLFNFLMTFTIAGNALLIINSRSVASFVAVFEVAALVAMVSILMATKALSNGRRKSEALSGGGATTASTGS